MNSAPHVRRGCVRSVTLVRRREAPVNSGDDMELRYYQTELKYTTYDDREDVKINHSLLSNPILQFRESIQHPWVPVPKVIEDITDSPR